MTSCESNTKAVMHANLINGPLDGKTVEFFKPLVENDKLAVIVKGDGPRRSAYQFTGIIDGDVAEFKYVTRMAGLLWKQYKKYSKRYQPNRIAS